MAPQVRSSKLATILRWLLVLLILQVWVSILANYPDYFPANFDSLFLFGREATFKGAYAVAFYIHIISSPFVLVAGLVLLSETVRRHCGRLHRILGRVQVGIMLMLMLPSGMVMSRDSFGGWPSGVSFFVLSLTTAICAIMGVLHARHRRFVLHRRWMLRCFVLICSAIALRLISGTMSLFDIPNAEEAYFVAAWSSWLLPLMVNEIVMKLCETSKAI